MNEVRYAVRILGPTSDQDISLVVPTMDPFMRSEDRVRVYEYVLRRQFGLAEIYADLHSRDQIIWSRLHSKPSVGSFTGRLPLGSIPRPPSGPQDVDGAHTV